MYDLVNAYLENGLRVILHKLPGTKTSACGLWVKQGSSYETDSNNGLSHLTEHLCLNPRNANSPKYQELMDRISSNGVIYNAATTKEYTCYYFTGLSCTLPDCLSALECIAKDNKVFPLDYFENEKNVVVQEAVSFYSAFQQIKERTSSALWGNSGTGKIIMGSIENIKSADRNQITNILDSAYLPNNSVLVVIGDLDYHSVLSMIEERFSSWESKRVTTFEKSVDSAPGIYLNHGNGQSAVLSLGFRTPGYSDIVRPSIDMLVRIIGQNGLKSKMVEEIRMKRGLSYNLGGFESFFRERGTIGFMAVSDKSKTVEIAKIMSDIINKVNHEGFTEEEIENEKKAMETTLLLSVDNITDHLRCIGKCAIMDQDFYIENEIRAIREITKENVNKASKECLSMDNLGVACIGGVSADEIVESIQIDEIDKEEIYKVS